LAVTGDDVTSQRNVTSLVDRPLTLRCPLAAAERGSSTTAWQKRDDDDDGSWRQLRRDADLRVRPGDELEFDRLLVSDAGFYRCFVTTARGVVVHSAPVVLVVHGVNVECLVNAKFHYTGWFGAGSKLVRTG